MPVCSLRCPERRGWGECLPSSLTLGKERETQTEGHRHTRDSERQTDSLQTQVAFLRGSDPGWLGHPAAGFSGEGTGGRRCRPVDLRKASGIRVRFALGDAEIKPRAKTKACETTAVVVVASQVNQRCAALCIPSEVWSGRLCLPLERASPAPHDSCIVARAAYVSTASWRVHFMF